MRNLRITQIYDDDPWLLTPLQESKDYELTYSDGEEFVIARSYMFGLRLMDNDCYYMRQSSDFEVIGGGCTRSRGAVCQWMSE